VQHYSEQQFGIMPDLATIITGNISVRNNDLQIPVLTYHSVNVISNTYQENDHIALAQDLRLINSLGYQIVSLREVFDWHQGRAAEEIAENAVALSLDDGSWFDFYDLEHPTCGLQRSMLGILKDFREEVGEKSQPGLHATSFVISSPQARDELDKKGLIGQGWWSDEWWPEAAASGLMDIECHSWDHNHPDLDVVAQRHQQKGSFSYIDNPEDCETQLAGAGDYIQERMAGIRPGFFAFPWGESNDYLLDTYLPEHRSRHGFEAAFSTDPRPVRRSDNRWNLPRFIFGRDWRSTSGLAKILGAA
jgi:hypothetical protein